MAFVYLDDKFPRHSKVMSAMMLNPLAPWLFVCGLAYCREHLNGGNPSNRHSDANARVQATNGGALTTVALWETSGDDWV